MSGRSALIVGATGATGKHLLRHLLSTPEYTTVGEYGRRVTSTEDLSAGKEKLEQHQIDFDKIGETDDQGLKAKHWDTVFITLGTTRGAAGSAEAFEKIDREYVIAAAKAAKSTDAGVKQRLVYLSSQGANINSSFLYPKSKGLTEQALAGLGYSDTIIFRPGFLANAERASGRLGEQIIEPFMKGISYFKPLSSKMQIPVSTLGQAIARAGLLGSGGLPASVQTSKAGTPGAEFTVLDNTAALALAQSATSV